MATGKALNGKPYAGNPHVRFDEGEVAPAATPRRGSLLYIKRFVQMAAMGIAWGLAFSAPGADTWYVDDDKYGASGNGESLATAFGTIQEAVARASAGDTVLVAPGTYSRGSSKVSGDSTSSRVVINKNVTVKSIEGAEKTFIVGAPDFENEPLHGLGPNAVRCVALSSAGAVLEGFTLTGGHVSHTSSIA